MSDPIAKNSKKLNYSFLLLAHLVCADQQIHNEEVKALQEKVNRFQLQKRTTEEMEKILAQEREQLSVEHVARQVSPGEQTEVMQQLLEIAYIDGFFAPLEREMINQIAKIWNWSSAEVQRLIQEATGFTDAFDTFEDAIEETEAVKLPFVARLLKGADSVLSPALVDNLAKIAPENVGRQIQQLRRDILLSGPEYDHAVQECAAIASEDFKFAELALKRTWLTLNDLGKNIQDQLKAVQNQTTGNSQAKTAIEVAKQLQTTKKALTSEIIKEIKSVRESISAKEHGLNHFSIAFMGKTKAGKSTLHAIITGEGWDAIGVGKQRTTRLNRVYEWKNIRIIDTPGIGAPGGKTDEEIAESIIEESDVICYVVTNDSIQESEFKFLQLLKEKAKPLIILLNVKYNLRDARRLEHFLKDPDKLFAMDGQSGLGGHMERIRRYAQQHYANDYFDIIPVMLLAAQLARETEHQENRDQLFQASRMQNFLDSIRVSLVEYGAIRRSQTLLGSTVGAIEKPDKWVTQQAETYQHLVEMLKNKHNTIRKEIEKRVRDNQQFLQQEIQTIFKDAYNAIPSFAEQHWDANGIALEIGWKETLKFLRFEERLNSAFEKSCNRFKEDIKEILKEIGNELQVLAKLSAGNYSLVEQDSTDFQSWFNLGANILHFLSFLNNFIPVFPGFSQLMGLVSNVMNWISGLFKSPEQKRREAVQNIWKSLSNQLRDNEQNTLNKSENDFGKYCNAFAISINTYFEELIQSLEKIAQQMQIAKGKLDQNINHLNRAYAKRILDCYLGKYEPLTDEVITNIIANIERDFGHSMTIITKSKLRLGKNPTKMNRILQEEVSIQVIQSTK